MGMAVPGFSKKVFGTGTEQTQKINLAAPGADEQAQRQILQDQLTNLQGQNNQNQAQVAGQAPTLSEADLALQDLFRSAITDYMSKDSSGKIDPNLQKTATQFVDETYTKPAQQQFQQMSREYQASQAETAASLGRSPLDSSFQQQQFRTLADMQGQLSAERGNRIATRIDDGYTNRLGAATQGLGGISAIQQQKQTGANFLNGLNQQALQNRVGLLNLQSQFYNNDRGDRLASAGVTQNTFKDAGLAGQGMAIGQLASLSSDINAKTNITAISDADVTELLNSIGAHSYEYKDEVNGVGTFFSPMAQEFEKSRIGKSFVEDSPTGKRVNYGRAFGAILAIQSKLNKDIQELKGR